MTKYTIRAIFDDGATITVSGRTKRDARDAYAIARTEAQRFDERPTFQITAPDGKTTETDTLWC